MEGMRLSRMRMKRLSLVSYVDYGVIKDNGRNWSREEGFKLRG